MDVNYYADKANTKAFLDFSSDVLNIDTDELLVMSELDVHLLIQERQNDAFDDWLNKMEVNPSISERRQYFKGHKESLSRMYNFFHSVKKYKRKLKEKQL